jgi:hypothetical protein
VEDRVGGLVPQRWCFAYAASSVRWIMRVFSMSGRSRLVDRNVGSRSPYQDDSHGGTISQPCGLVGESVNSEV